MKIETWKRTQKKNAKRRKAVRRFNIHKRLSNYDLARKTPEPDAVSEIKMMPVETSKPKGFMGAIKNIFKRGSQRGS